MYDVSITYGSPSAEPQTGHPEAALAQAQVALVADATLARAVSEELADPLRQARAVAVDLGQPAAVFGQNDAHSLGDVRQPGTRAADLGNQITGGLLAGLLHR